MRTMFVVAALLSLLAPGIVAVSLAAEEPRFEPPAVGTKLYFSNSKTPYEVTGHADGTIKLRRGRIDREAVGVFFLGTPSWLDRNFIDRMHIAGIFPLGTDKRVSWVQSEGAYTWDYSLTVLRRERLQIKLGHFDTWVVALHQKGRGDNYYEARTTFWYSPEVRFWIRYTHEHIAGVRNQGWDDNVVLERVELPAAR